MPRLDFPIPATSPEQQKAVERAVDRILAAQARGAAADGSGWERGIASQPRKVFPQMWLAAFAAGGDPLGYALYGLTPEEIQIVEGAAK